ncbi:MAG: NADH-quinone oxidoreductase subunit H [Candidatus Omnitrophica bacterium]|nr:NADH-quinone oxidoreductase subunit H [Candidatus Omnitrophota bacterium]
MMADLAIKLGLIGIFIAGFVLNVGGLHAWVERKQSALMQDRIGANRAFIILPWRWAAPINWLLRPLNVLGLFHPVADAVKMFTKEDFIPPKGDRFLHTLAPFVSMFFALAAFAGIPFGDRLVLGERVIELQIAKIDIALLYIFAMLSLGVYGVILAGFASKSNYALLGSLRASAQMISYEIALGISIIGVILIYGTLDMQEMVRAQGKLLFGFLPMWGIFLQPVAFFIFMAAALAETKRIPFDLPEGESEIIGYFVEYSGMKFGIFFMVDFIETVMVACLMTTLFFGGWQVPYLYPDGFHFPWGGVIPVNSLVYVLAGVASFTVKVLFFCWLFMTVRWTLPRFRYDQLMTLGWKVLFPISLVNVVLTALAVLVYKVVI